MLKIRRIREDAILPTRATDGSAGFDLCSIQEVTIYPGFSEAVGTGIVVAIPAGHAGMIRSRSGLAFRHDVTAFHATVDCDYRGELVVLLRNHSSRRAYRVEPGDRIAQLVIVPVAMVDVAEVLELDDTRRGSAGFGSTGS